MDNSVTEPIITLLEAFDVRGIHCGYAVYVVGTSFGWRVRAGDAVSHCDTRQEAEVWLCDHGAETIKDFQ